MRGLFTITLFTICFRSSSGKHAARGARHKHASGSSSTIARKLAILSPRALGAPGDSITVSASDVALLLASTPTPTPTPTPTSPPPASGPTLGSGGPDFPPSAPPSLDTPTLIAPISFSANSFLNDAANSISLSQSAPSPAASPIRQELAQFGDDPERPQRQVFHPFFSFRKNSLSTSSAFSTSSCVDLSCLLSSILSSLTVPSDSASQPPLPPPPATTSPGAGGSGAPASAPSFIPTPVPSSPALTGTSSTAHSSPSSLSSLSFPITTASPSASSRSPSLNNSIPATTSSVPTAATSSVAPTKVSSPAAGATIHSRSNHTAFVLIGILIPLLVIALAISIYRWRRRRRRLGAVVGDFPAIEESGRELDPAAPNGVISGPREPPHSEFQGEKQPDIPVIPVSDDQARESPHSELQREKQPHWPLYSIPVIPVSDDHSATPDAPSFRPPSPTSSSASTFGEPLPPYSRPLPRVPLAS
ncbi:hypothetical protein B0H16DRAFT_1901146 [Mycena metata]|uniref:Uncharacterized protein n=1 Tax=Mycena metata TaxID=1033252 RepID=A0AAD7MB61_9AGAR|nr:hypothetical protein B0H16DRAFT_1901146 [Mycena metata]